MIMKHTWEQEPGEPVLGLPLNVALQLDALRLKREGKKRKVEFKSLYQLQDKLKAHREKLERITAGTGEYYRLFTNPLV